MRLVPAVALVFLLFYGCKKEEGPGGTSTIKGKVIVYDYDPAYLNPAPSNIFPAGNERVFIIYGESNTTYNDDFRCSYDGSYEFKHLQKGKYRLFAYSKDSTGAYNGSVNSQAPDVPIFVDVEITGNGKTFEAPDIIILDNNGR